MELSTVEMMLVFYEAVIFHYVDFMASISIVSNSCRTFMAFIICRKLCTDLSTMVGSDS